MTLPELRDALKAATGPDKALDALIGEACGVVPGSKNVYRQNRWPKELLRVAQVWPPYTASVDAALTLVPEGVTLWDLASRRRKTQFRAEFSWLVDDPVAVGEEHIVCRAATPALALSLARVEYEIARQGGRR